MSRRNLLATAFAIISGHGTPFAAAFASSHGQLRSPAFSRTVSYLAKLDCHEDGDSSSLSSTRRETFQKTFGLAIAIVASSLVSRPDTALAFPNKISNQYDDRPKQRGSTPKGLGVAIRKDMAGEEYLGLKPCGAAPNCFCSTDPLIDDPDHNIPSWKWPTDILSSQEDAFQQLYDVVKAYPPGQSNIDGGGFDIVTFDPKAGYMYVQFESLKNGYVDDVEMAVVGRGDNGSNVVHVRSSSRLGYLDFGVNAKRLNYLAKSLRDKGWDAPGVELTSHRGYAEENGLKAL